MKQQLLKPQNWQDFESLCKILWGEVWQCTEIKKNGRSGQKQNGVDIYGVPAGETNYYGIQCKGKDGYTKSLLTTKEIDIELDKAKSFLPPLKKFYFATTANKDVAIEEYIRLKNQEFNSLGLFEIHLFSWEDIADLIDENPRTHEWYVKKQNFKTKFSADITFENGEHEMDFEPEFTKWIIAFIDKDKLTKAGIEIPKPNIPDLSFIPIHLRKHFEEQLKQEIAKDIQPDSEKELKDVQPIIHHNPLSGLGHRQPTVNKSVCSFILVLNNNGSEVIEDYKVHITINDVIRADTVNKSNGYLDLGRHTYNVFFSNSHNAIFQPYNTLLVQHDSVKTDRLCFRPFSDPKQITVDWKLIARNYTNSGRLTLNIKPRVETIKGVRFLSNPTDKSPITIVKTKYH